MSTKKQLELAEADFLGHDPASLACTQCAPACPYHLGRVYQGAALIMCGKKPGSLEVMSAARERCAREAAQA